MVTSFVLCWLPVRNNEMFNTFLAESKLKFDSKSKVWGGISQSFSPSFRFVASLNLVDYSWNFSRERSKSKLGLAENNWLEL